MNSSGAQGRAASLVVDRDELAEQLQEVVALLAASVAFGNVKAIRAKLEDEPIAPRHIVTVRGVGYRFVT